MLLLNLPKGMLKPEATDTQSPVLRVPHSLDEAYAQWARLSPANVELCLDWLYESLLPNWLLLCHTAVQSGQFDSLRVWQDAQAPLDALYRLAGSFFAERMRTVLDLALEIQRGVPTPEDPSVPDLIHYLRQGRWLPAKQAVLLTTALSPSDNEAEAVTLRIEWLPNAEGSYPHPATLWFIPISEEFLETAQQAFGSQAGFRWSIETLPMGASLQGTSLGGAFRLGAQVVQSRSADLRAWAVLARYDPATDHLLPVGNFQAKYDAVRRERRVRHIIISDSQISPYPERTIASPSLSPIVRTLQRSLRLRHLLKRASFLSVVPLVALLWTVHLGTYRYSAMPSGRVMLHPGLWRSTPIDTGYNLSELLPDQFQLGWRWRMALTPAIESSNTWGELANALIDPTLKSQLYDGLGDHEQAEGVLRTTRVPTQQIRFWLQQAKLHPDQSQSLAERIKRLAIPEEDYTAQVMRWDALHQMGVVSTADLLRALRPLSLPPTDDFGRLQALILIAQHDRSTILDDPSQSTFIMRCSTDRNKRALALQVMAYLSLDNPFEVLPLAEPYQNDPLVQSSREQVQMLLMALLTPDWQRFYEAVRTTEDAYVVERAEMVALEIALSGALKRFALQRATLQERWRFLMTQLEDEQARMKGVYRSALCRTFLLVTPKKRYPELADYLRDYLQTQPPLYLRLALHQLLREVELKGG